MFYSISEAIILQINRLFEIIYILLNKKIVTAGTLAEYFEVSVRTIYRDIGILSSAGIPIYTNQGKGGGIALLDNYVLNKSILSENEQNEILFALQSLSLTPNSEKNKILSKLSSLFDKNIVNWIEVDPSPWGSNKDQIYKFTTLKNAILNYLIIEFEYINNCGRKSTRKVEPVKLLFKANTWYLYGFCLYRNEYRTFKISRMSNIKVTDDHFARKSERIKQNQQKSSQKMIDVKLEISSNSAYRVYDEFSEEKIIKNQDGSFTIDASFPESKWLIGYLLSFGDDIDIIEPQQLRNIIQDKAEKIFNKYH